MHPGDGQAAPTSSLPYHKAADLRIGETRLRFDPRMQGAAAAATKVRRAGPRGSRASQSGPDVSFVPGGATDFGEEAFVAGAAVADTAQPYAQIIVVSVHRWTAAFGDWIRVRCEMHCFVWTFSS